MAPNEKQNLNDLKQKQDSIDFWKNKYNQIENLSVDEFTNTIDFEILHKDYENYKKKIYELNSIIYIASRLNSNFFSL